MTSRARLSAAWRTEPKFLLREVAAMLDEGPRAQLVEVWPRMLVLAEHGRGRAGGKAKRGEP